MDDRVAFDAGERIKRIRRGLGLSQVELARLLGVSNVTVNRWEHDKATPSRAMLTRIEALVAPAPRPERLRFSETPFVGRAHELAELGSLIEEHALVTLVGPPGSGKTRLAVETATAATARFVDGVVAVDLAPLPPDADVAGRVADALGVRVAGAEAILDRLAEALAGRSLLLLLDNCEHLPRRCRDLLDRLLPDCPALRVLATSRAPLRHTHELVYRVEPLPLPAVDDPGAIARSDAVRLFVLSARRHRPDFAVATREEGSALDVDFTPALAKAVATICRRLDGLPLAIELAAARLAVLSAPQIAARLDDRFGLLRDDHPAAPARQRTLAAAIAWSIDLLDEADRRLFARLAVFAGSFDLESAEAVAQGTGDRGQGTGEVGIEARRSMREAPVPCPPSPVPSVLDALARLVERSLVIVERTTVEEPRRYRLLESLREYAVSSLVVAGDEAEAPRRHAAHFLARAEAAAADFGGPAQPEALRRLTSDDDNLRGALAWAISAREGAYAVPLAALLWRFWHARGRYLEGVDRLERALAAGDGAPSAAVAEATYGLGRLRMRLARYPPAAAAAAQSRARFAALGDRAGEVRALNLAGLIAQRSADYPRSRALHEEALALSRSVDDRRALGDSLIYLGQLHNLDRDYVTAERYFAEGWELIRETGDLEEEAVVLNNLGDNAARRGEPRRALGFYERSLAISRALDHPEGIAAKLVNLAEARLLVSDATKARALAEEGVARYRLLGNREHQADALYVLGLVLTTTGEQAGALAALQEALDLFRGVGNTASVGQTLDLLAGVAARLGDAETAARWLGAAEAIRQRVRIGPYPPSGYDGIVAAVRRTLGPPRYAELLAAGAARAEARTLVEVAVFAAAAPRPPAPEMAALTDRQREILRLLGRGLSNREIGRELAISVRTVERHLTAIYTVIGVTRRAEAVAYALTTERTTPT